MSIYQRFTNTDEGNELVIEHNLSAYDDEGRAVGLYIHGGSAFGTYSVDDIPRMIETLQAIYDDFEANKPKEPEDLAEALSKYLAGTVIRFYGERGYWMKTQSNEWVSSNRGETTFAGWTATLWPFDVIYNPAHNPEEAN